MIYTKIWFLVELISFSVVNNTILIAPYPQKSSLLYVHPTTGVPINRPYKVDFARYILSTAFLISSTL